MAIIFSIQYKKIGLFILTGLFVLICRPLLSQVSPLYSMNYEYGQFINPAITGAQKTPIIDISRQQYWIGNPQSPNTTCAAFSARLGAFNFYDPRMLLNRSNIFSSGRMGVGGLIMQSNDGPLSSYCMVASYAYYLPLNMSGRELSLGLSSQFLNYSVNNSLLSPMDQGDPELKQPGHSKILPEPGCGIYYHDEQLFIGAGVDNFFKSYTDYNSSKPKYRDFNFQSGYRFFLKYCDLEPSVFITKTDIMPALYYAQLKLYWNLNWFTIGYNSSQAMLASLGVTVQRFYISYIFQQNFNQLGNYFGSSNELMIGINIGHFEPNRIIKRSIDKF